MKHYILIAVLVAGVGCKKSVQVDAPETNPTRATLYTNDASAAAVVTYIYARMAGAGGTGFAQGNNSIGLLTGLSADELQTYTNVTGDFNNFYRNNNSINLNLTWRELYQYIFVANAVIEGIENSTGGMTDSVKKQLTGEALFMRAFLHFYVVNLWGDAPYITTTDYQVNKTAARTPKTEAFGKMVGDLQQAQQLLPDNYVTPTGGPATERLRPNKWTATAFLARVYLYMGEWAKAESEAGTILSNTAKFALVTDLTKVFLKDSKEAIWQVPQVLVSRATVEGDTYLLTPATPIGNNNPASLRTAFVNSFETNDKRRTSWIDSPVISTVKYYCPSKYKIKQLPTNVTPVPTSNEYFTIFRLAEQYLIRAEARAQQSKVTEAQTDLNAVRTRANLGPTDASDKSSLLTVIERERQFELFTEWGHRWLDLKRTGRVDAVMSVVTPSKGGTWNTDMQLYPIPKNELLLNPNLAPQNPGYN